MKRKKKLCKILAILVALCCFFSSIGPTSLQAASDEAGDVVSGNEVGIKTTGTIELQESDAGLLMKFPQSAGREAYASVKSPYSLMKDSIRLNIKEISGNDYSIVIGLLNSASEWYKTEAGGYFIIYEQSGNFFVIQTADGDSISKAEVLYQNLELAPLTGDLNLEVALVGDEYQVTVNGGAPYVIPISEKLYLQNPEEVYVAFGTVSGGKFYNDTSTSGAIQWYGSRTQEVSFMIEKEVYAPTNLSTRTLKPFADPLACISDGNEIIRPSEPITRGEAIVAVSKMLVEEADIKDIYESDFLDLKKTDPNYSIYAYMEKCGFLPEFGDKLMPNQAITRKEFMQLLQGTEKVEVNEPNATITRQAAAEAICDYLGITLGEPSSVRETVLRPQNAEELRTYVNQAIELSQTTDAKVTIELQDTTYPLSSPIKIDGLTYGEHDVSIQFQNAEGASPVITGALDIEGSKFKLASGKEYYSYQLTDDDKVDGKWPKFRDLYVNGERMELARSEKFVFGTEWREGTTNCFYVDSASLSGITGANVSPLELNIDNAWLHKYYQVTSVASVSGKCGIALSEDAYAYVENADKLQSEGKGNQNLKIPFTGYEYWFTNHLGLLDEPGEFFYDDEAGIIYVYPYQDVSMGNAKVSYPKVERLFELDGASSVSFEGITFTGTTFNFTSEYGYNSYQGGMPTWNAKNTAIAKENIGDTDFDTWRYDVATVGAIAGKNTKHISVKNCTFDGLGTAGINLKGGNRNITISGNAFTDIAMSAIILGQNNLQWSIEDGQSNIIIANNYIYDVAKDYHTFPGVLVFRCNNIAVMHNSIMKTPYSGLHLGWFTNPGRLISVRGAEIAYNKLENNMYAGEDGAAIYVCGANSIPRDRGVYNAIHHNYIKANGYTYTVGKYWGENAGIYLDNNSSNYSVYENVMTGYNNESAKVAAVHIQTINETGGDDLRALNNVVKDNYSTMKFLCALSSEKLAEQNIRVSGNELYQTTQDLPADAQTIMEKAGSAEKLLSTKLDVKAKVSETYIKLLPNAETPEGCLTFSITNHGDASNAYTVTSSSEKAVIPSAPLTLDSNSSGEIQVSFRGGSTASRELLDFTITDSYGRKVQFDRLLTLETIEKADDGIPTADMFSDSTGVQNYYAGGVVITGSETVNEYTLLDEVSALSDGTRIDIRPMTKEQNLSFKIGGYVIGYGVQGQLTIDGKNCDTMKPLSELSKLSVYMKKGTSSSEIVVDIYDVNEKLCDRFQNENMALPSGSDNKVTFYAANEVSYRVSYLAAVSKLVVGDASKHETEVPIYIGEGEVLPTGYLDTGEALLYVQKWTKDNMDYERYSKADTGAIAQELIDCKMLDIAWQDTSGNNSGDKRIVRFLSSVDGLDYKNAGIVLSPSVAVPTIENASNKETTVVYTNVVSNNSKVSVKDVYDDYSMYMFGRVIQNIPNGQQVYVRSYVTLPDGKILYGRTKLITIEASSSLTNGYEGVLEPEDFGTW